MKALLNTHKKGRIKAYSARSKSIDRINFGTIEFLTRFDCPTDNVRSKLWDEFVKDSGAKMDFGIAFCDNATNKPYSYWLDTTLCHHYGILDIADATDSNALSALHATYIHLVAFVNRFLLLDFQKTKPRKCQVITSSIALYERTNP